MCSRGPAAPKYALYVGFNFLLVVPKGTELCVAAGRAEAGGIGAVSQIEVVPAAAELWSPPSRQPW